MPNAEATASTRLLWGAIDYLQSQGADVTSWLSRGGLSLTEARSPRRRISQATLCALWESAAETMDDPGFGLRAGANPNVAGHPDVMRYLMCHSETFAESMQLGRRYQRLWQTGREAGLELTAGRGIFAARAAPGVPVSRVFSEFVLAHFAQFSSWSGIEAGHDALVEVHFPLERRAEARLYEERFGAKLRFGCGYQGLVFRSEVLDAKPLRSDPALKRLLLRLADTEMAELDEDARRSTRTSVADRVLDHVSRSLGEELPGLPVVAKRLGMSARTLRRRLADERTTYSDVADRWRRTAARELIADPAISLNEIAVILGFSQHGAFTRAFQRWFGVTPSAFRSRLLAPVSADGGGLLIGPESKVIWPHGGSPDNSDPA